MSLIDELVKEATTPLAGVAPTQRTTARSRLESRRAGLPYNPGGAPAPTPPAPAAPAAPATPAPAASPAPESGGFWSTMTGAATAPFVAGGTALHGLASNMVSPWVYGNTGNAVVGGMSSGLTPRASAQRKGNFLDELVKHALSNAKPRLNPEEQGPAMAVKMAMEDAKTWRTIDLNGLLA